MGPLLKALGLTIWGLVTLGLLAVFIFVGYGAAVKFRSPDFAHFDGSAGSLKIPEPKNFDSAKPTAWEAIRKRFDEAAEQRQFGKVLDSGKQLYDAGLTSPDDLLIIARAFSTLGELYYGFGDYQRAIFAIQRGLDIGGVSHLDDAYVYLGQSELKLNNTEAACRSFRSLSSLPNLNPRILKLWQLFADMHC